MKYLILPLLLVSLSAAAQIHVEVLPPSTPATTTVTVATPNEVWNGTGKERILGDLNPAVYEAVTKAVQASGEEKTLKELSRLAEGPSRWDRTKGLLTFVNVVLVTAGFLVVIAVVWLARLYIWHIILVMGPLVQEVFIFAVAALCLVVVRKLDGAQQLFLSLPGALLAGVGIFYGHYLRSSKDQWGKLETSSLFSLTSVVWAFLAIWLGSSVIGFLAVLALMVSLGFSVIVLPGVVGLGFDDDDVIPRATLAALVLVIIHVASIVAPSVVPFWYVHFATGFAFIGTFVYFLGLLIMSSKWYSRERWGITNLITVVSGVLAIYLGNVYDIPLLMGIGGTFFYLYIIELYYEIPWDGAGWAWSLLGLAGLLYAFSWFAQKYPQYFLWGLQH
jgi:hypothetical protein